jgi:tungstate transport system permease protein
MNDLWQALTTAMELLVTLDASLVEIIARSLGVSLTAVLLATVLGLPLGAVMALSRFPGRRVLLVVMNALMGLPPVVVGLIVLLMLSRSGPLGALGLLFTPTAMIIAQTILVLPIIAALSASVIESLWQEYEDQMMSLGAGPVTRIQALLWDGRFTLMTAVLAGFGRANAEVGAVMIVGGNIDHVTRVMTTAITLEASRGDLALALGLGIVLLLLSLAINTASYSVREFARQRYQA